jgi:hypothetical protein
MWDGTFAGPEERKRFFDLEAEIAECERLLSARAEARRAAAAEAYTAFQAAEAAAARLHSGREWRELPRDHPDWEVVRRADAARAAWIAAKYEPEVDEERDALQERLRKAQERLNAGA